MINGDILGGVQNLYEVVRRLCVHNIDIQGYKLGNNRYPVIICKSVPRETLQLEGEPEAAGDYLSYFYCGCYLIWKPEG